MTDTALAALAEAAGLAREWRDVHGKTHRVAPDTMRALLAALGFAAGSAAQIAESRAVLAAEAERLPPLLTLTIGPEGVAIPGGKPGDRFALVLEDGARRDGELVPGWNGEARLPGLDQPGYHRLELPAGHCVVAAAPPRCFDLPGKPRAWGLAAQVYSLRRRGDLGIGDFGGLVELGRAAAARGAACLAASPLHALFAADPHRFGPYAPSSRLFLNPLHADPSLVFDDAAPPDVAADPPLIDWPAATRRKLDRLRALFARHGEDPRFAAWRAESGTALEDHARFEALHAHHFSNDPARWHWRSWPAPHRDPRSAAVESFAQEQREAVAFHAFAQFVAAASLAEAQARLRTAGMPIGLVTDLAIGTDGGGSQAWSRQNEILQGPSVGAPPDIFSPLGQDWGLTAFSPAALRASGHAAFLEVLRAALRHAGGVRVDHVMGLLRLWLVPPGAGPAEGAYLHYPAADLLRLLPLESHRHRAIVIGEDLGTVPEGFHERLQAAGVLGMRVLWFERDEAGRFTPPAEWSPGAVAMTTTHDLPTAAGWWEGRDIAWRTRLHRFPDAAAARRETEARVADRALLWQAMCDSGATSGEPPAETDGIAAAAAAIRHTGGAACALALLPLEDALALPEQPNLPGTVEGHPNWQHRLPGDAATLLDAPGTAARLAAFAATRP